MAFYIKPPRGYLQLSTFEAITWHRLEFLMKVSRCQNVISMRDLVQETGSDKDSDCLIEGSDKDLVSHFMLRLSCAQNNEMASFLLKTETELFAYRFSCMNEHELNQCLKPLFRLLRMIKYDSFLRQEYQDVINICKCLTETYDWRTLIHHYVNLDSGMFVKVPFIYVLELVRRRSVFICNGEAFVPCSKLNEVLTTVFRKILERGLELAIAVLPSLIESDSRMAKLLRGVKVYFARNSGMLHPYPACEQLLRHEDINLLAEMFPPCMQNLNKHLRAKHRLHHHSRIQYTLFLKELGLPIQEALQFWKLEYSQPQGQGHSACSHIWAKDAKRYTYSIRHLYGLEGARINYRGHCCSSIQTDLLSTGESGGCPFKHFDKKHLIKTLQLGKYLLDDVHEILSLVKDGCYSQACAVYLRATVTKAKSAATRNMNILKRDISLGEMVGHPISLSNGQNIYKCTRGSIYSEAECCKELHLHTNDVLSKRLKLVEISDDLFKQIENESDSSDSLRLDSDVMDLSFRSQPVCNGKGSRTLIHTLNLTQVTSAQCKSCVTACSCDIQEDAESGINGGKTNRELFHKPVDYFVLYKSLLKDIKSFAACN